MSSTLQHHGYEGTVEYCAEDRMLHGRLLCARDLVSYGGIDLAELETNFRSAVDEYLAFCKEMGKLPDPPSRPTSEITLRYELETQAIQLAERHGWQLDTVVNHALQDYLAKAS